MRYNDLLNRITNGTLAENDDVWLVDVRHDDLGTLNIIPPTKARITAPDDRNTELDRHGAEHYFRPLKKNGDMKVAVIRPYRVIRGLMRDGSIHIFLTQDEANRAYVQQCEAVKEQVQQEQDNSNRRFEEKLAALDARISSVR